MLELVSCIYTTVELSRKEAGAVWCLLRLRLFRVEFTKPMVGGLPGRGISLGYVSDLVPCTGLI